MTKYQPPIQGGRKNRGSQNIRIAVMKLECRSEFSYSELRQSLVSGIRSKAKQRKKDSLLGITDIITTG